MVFGRLIGQETEYAVRFSPERGHPGNERIYHFLIDAIGRHVETRRGLDWQKSQFFTQNGGAFQYEYVPYEREGGLVEGATPECRGPAQLLLYQRAQEALLLKAIPIAERWLAVGGYPGKLGLLKNCRDSEGHVYGAQESFEATVATGLTLLLFRAGLVVLAPLLLVTFATSLLVGWLVFARHRHRWRHSGLIASPTHEEQRELEASLYRALLLASRPFVTAFLGWVRLFAFRKVRRSATAFIVSRSVWSGAGSVGEGGSFVLAEKAPAITSVLRTSPDTDDRAIFDTGNLLKAALQSEEHPHLLASLFRRRQRLQLGLADSSMIEEAEFLKIGATALVIDMAEAGYLGDAPRVKAPVAAVHSFAADPALEVAVETTAGPMTALQIQRYYADKAKSFVAEARTASLEARAVVDLWDDLLGALERGEMERLVGRLDWVTKRFLLERVECDGDPSLLKTIDLRYHELGDGYARRFEATGYVQSLLSPDEVERAVTEAPADTPAYTRGRFIRSELASPSRVAISWRSAVIGSGLRGKVIPFPDRGPLAAGEDPG